MAETCFVPIPPAQRAPAGRPAALTINRDAVSFWISFDNDRTRQGCNLPYNGFLTRLLVRGAGVNPFIPIEWRQADGVTPLEVHSCFTTLGYNLTCQYPSQLLGWNLAAYIRCVIEANRVEWSSGTPYTDGKWNGLMMRHLPDWNPSTGIKSIDPFDPFSVPQMQTYDSLPACTYDAQGNETNAPCKTGLLIPGVNLPSTGPGDNLPYLPKSIITGVDSARLKLAEATRDLWNKVGIFQDIETIARWVNAKEHNVFKDSADQTARQDMLQFIHFTYWRSIPPGTNRLISFLSAWSVALFQVRTMSDGVPVNDRTYNFLKDVLTPTNLLSNGAWSAFATDPSLLNWSSSSQSQYSPRIQGALAGGATRTFGSTELSGTQLQTLRSRGAGSADSNGFVVEIVGSGGSVFLMTENQFSWARNNL